MSALLCLFVVFLSADILKIQYSLKNDDIITYSFFRLFQEIYASTRHMCDLNVSDDRLDAKSEMVASLIARYIKFKTAFVGNYL